METIATIRRDHRVAGKSIKAIARGRGVSRNAVGKVLRSEATAIGNERAKQPHPRRGAGNY